MNDTEDRHRSAAAELKGAVEEVARRLKAAMGEEDVEISHGDPSPAGDAAALRSLSENFGLSNLERRIVVMCAGYELDAGFGKLIERLSPGSRPGPTVGLARALGSSSDAIWSAFAPDAPLRRWRLLEVSSSGPLLRRRCRLAERVFLHLTGVSTVDERLSGYVEPNADRAGSGSDGDSQVASIASEMRRASFAGDSPVIQLCGPRAGMMRRMAGRLARRLDREPIAWVELDLPPTPEDRDELRRLWERESRLRDATLVVEVPEQKERRRRMVEFLERLRAPTIVTARQPFPLERRPVRRFQVEPPRPELQRTMWRDALGAAAGQLNGEIDEIVGQFDFDRAAIESVSAGVLREVDSNEADGDSERLAERLWRRCASQQRPELERLAHRIEPKAEWDDLVLVDDEKSTLETVATHVRRRMTVYRDWGFAEKSSRGLGIAAVFSGESGTGKTMAAEVLANELALDLYRIDLSSVVSKYIGETEKNLRRIFDAAEGVGAILLFDEADALFGKRSEVEDSHDRYANVEVSYLLQRIEAYRGLAILTTNFKEAIDSAFMRRIRFVVDFPFPDADARAAIWRKVFPEATPTADLDFRQLAELKVTGGNIRNIAMDAAFRAADRDESVGMEHLLEAARTEYSKIGKRLTNSEIGGWARSKP